MNPRYEQCSSDGESVLKPRKIAPLNVIIRLIQRETCGHVRNGTNFHMCRSFYQNIVPNFTVVNVEKPPCFLRKFTPDGKYFIAFSSDQTSVEVYRFRGPSAAEDLLAGYTGDIIANEVNEELRSGAFSRFFHLKHTIAVTTTGEQLNRECSLFVNDGRFVIVGSACYVPEDPTPNFSDIFRNNESVSPHPRSPLEDCSLHIIDIVNGRLCDTRTMKTDKIFLSHNQGLYLYQDTLAVLSVQHQSIHIFRITNEGYFVDVRTIGRFCFDDDELLVNQVGVVSKPFREATVNALKHRLLVFFFRRAVELSKRENNLIHLRRYFFFVVNWLRLSCSLVLFHLLQVLPEFRSFQRFETVEDAAARWELPSSEICQRGCRYFESTGTQQSTSFLRRL